MLKKIFRMAALFICICTIFLFFAERATLDNEQTFVDMLPMLFSSVIGQKVTLDTSSEKAFRDSLQRMDKAALDRGERGERGLFRRNVGVLLTGSEILPHMMVEMAGFNMVDLDFLNGLYVQYKKNGTADDLKRLAYLNYLTYEEIMKEGEDYIVAGAREMRARIVSYMTQISLAQAALESAPKSGFGRRISDETGIEQLAAFGLRPEPAVAINIQRTTGGFVIFAGPIAPGSRIYYSVRDSLSYSGEKLLEPASVMPDGVILPAELTVFAVVDETAGPVTVIARSTCQVSNYSVGPCVPVRQ